MGNCSSRSHYLGRPQPHGPLFRGHYQDDFFLHQPRPKKVRFGADPPAWEFYRDAPPEDNLVNTMYYAPLSMAHAYIAPRPDLRGYRRRK